jgi:arabinofuranosyltransferase
VVAVFGVIYYFNAYVCDDAFITFRCVDNLVRGHGLVYNVGERVQVFTSPLYALLLSVFYVVVYDRSDVPNPGRIYWLAILLSFALSAAALLRLRWAYRSQRGFWGLFAILLSSQAFVTFTSSGLETPLTYLILVLFYTSFLRSSFLNSERDYFLCFLLTSLGLLNRLDLAFLFLPPVAYALIKGWRLLGWRIIRPGLAGFAPLGIWMTFSVIYYGFLLPNSYYAKLGLDVPRSILTSMGAGYLAKNLIQDPATLVLCGIALALCWRDRRSLLAGLAICLHLLYVLCLGGDFLGFRFLAPPFLVACISVFHGFSGRYPRALSSGSKYVILASLAYGLLVPSSPLRAFHDPPAAHDVAFYYPASALSRWTPGARFPFATFLYVTGPEECQRLRSPEFSVAVWGDGLNAFCRGFRAHLIDPHGVTDPLMARLSLPIHRPFEPGHLAKPLPVGYVESVLTAENRIADQDLSTFYARLCLLTSGSLWNSQRWHMIMQMNFTSAARYPRHYSFLRSVPVWMRENAGAH